MSRTVRSLLAAVLIFSVNITCGAQETSSQTNGASQEPDAPRQIPKLIVCTGATDDIFWPGVTSPPYNAFAEPLAARDSYAILRVALTALSKYPDGFVSEYIDAIYFVKDLRWRDVEYGGLVDRRRMYVCVRRDENPSIRSDLERSIHHEIGHAVMNNNDSKFPRDAWLSINDENHEYFGSGIAAIRAGRSSGRWQHRFASRGFVCEYATANIQEDFACLVELMFANGEQFWNQCDRYPKIARKAYTAIRFYHAVDPQFNLTYFMELCDRPPPAWASSELDLEIIQSYSRFQLLEAIKNLMFELRDARDQDDVERIVLLGCEFEALMEELRRRPPPMLETVNKKSIKSLSRDELVSELHRNVTDKRLARSESDDELYNLLDREFEALMDALRQRNADDAMMQGSD